MDTALRERLRLAAERLFPGHPILVAYAYGSRVSGRPRPASDLDVGYYLEGYRTGQTLPLGKELRLAAALSEAVGLDVDLRDLASAPLELRGRVLEEGIRLYSANDAARVELECELLGRYHDYKEIFRRMHEERLRAIAARGI
jgi:predicted nucleotidyltransferase